MPITSRVGQVQDTFAEQLRARPGLQTLETEMQVKGPVPVDVGWPEGQLRAVHVWIDGAIDDWEEEWSTTGQAGPAAKDESFTLTVNIAVTLKAKTYAPLRDVALAIASQVELQLHEDFQIGGTAKYASVVGGALVEGVLTDGTRQVLIERRVQVRTHLTRP